MQSLKAAAILFAAASLCVAQTTPRTLRVEFEGNRVFTSEQLQRALRPCYEASRTETFDAKQLDACLRWDVSDVMRRAGFVRARFGEVRTTRLGEMLTVVVPVEEHEIYRVGHINIEGMAHFDAKSLREMLPLKRGDIADTVAVGRWAFDHLQRKYANEGFIQYQADIEPAYRFTPGESDGVVDLTIKVNEGKQFILRSLKFEGDAGAPVSVMREVLGLKEGEVFKQQEYADAVWELNHHKLFDWDDGRYEDIDLEKDVEFLVDEEAGALDIKVHLIGRGQERAARPGAEADGARPGKPSLTRRP